MASLHCLGDPEAVAEREDILKRSHARCLSQIQLSLFYLGRVRHSVYETTPKMQPQKRRLTPDAPFCAGRGRHEPPGTESPLGCRSQVTTPMECLYANPYGHAMASCVSNMVASMVYLGYPRSILNICYLVQHECHVLPRAKL